MIAQCCCKAVRDGWFAAEDLISYCCGCGHCVGSLQSSPFIRCNQEHLVKLNLLEALQLTD